MTPSEVDSKIIVSSIYIIWFVDISKFNLSDLIIMPVIEGDKYLIIFIPSLPP